MERQRSALSPRNEGNREWVPSCFGGFGCEESAGESENHADMKTTRSAPILILKGLGTMTLGRLGERNNILRDDIVTWKHRIEDSLYIGWITYTTRSSLPDDFHEFAKDTMYLSRAEEKTAFIVIEDIEERSAYEVEYCLMEENGASQTLLQLLKVLEVRANRSFVSSSSTNPTHHFPSVTPRIEISLALYDSSTTSSKITTPDWRSRRSRQH